MINTTSILNSGSSPAGIAVVRHAECGESKEYGASLQGFAKVRVVHMERLQRGDKDEAIRVRCQSSPLG